MRSTFAGAGLLAAVVVFIGEEPAFAQSAPSPSLTPPGASVLEPIDRPDRISIPRGAGVTVPEGAGDVTLMLVDLQIEDGFAELDGVARDLGARLIGRTITVEQVYAFANELQSSYFAAGYPLARVVVPPQDFDAAAATVSVRVIDGWIERIDLEGAPAAVRRPLQATLSDLTRRPRLSGAEFERALALAGSIHGLELTAALAPGVEVGGTVLVVAGVHRGWSGVIAADNRVDDTLGGWQATASVAANSLFGRGEQVYLTLAGLPEGDVFSDDAVRRYASLGARAPLGGDGWMTGLSIDYSTTRPEDELAPFRLASEYSSISAFLSYSLLIDRDDAVQARLSVDAASDLQKTEVTSPATTLYGDRLRVVRAALEGRHDRRSGLRADWAATVSKGIDGLGARSADEADNLKPLSRLGADADFTALALEGRLARPLGGPFVGALGVSGQYAFDDALLQSERYSPLRANGLAGPAAGSLTGDAGWSTRAELGTRFGGSQWGFNPYVSVAAARVLNETPSALETSSLDATEVGVGFRLRAGPATRPISLGVEWSLVESERQALDRSWLSATVSARF